VPAAPQLTERRVFLIDKPGAAQSQIRIGWVGVARSTPDYFPITVMNTILGGAFTSRLNQNLREEHGYSYGARSGFDMRASAGPFQAAAGVQTDKTAESLTEFFNELEGIRAPVSEDELTKATNYVALGFPSEFETTGDMLRRLEELVVNDLPDEYFASYIPNIQAVSAADVQRVAERYVQPDKMAVVVVGDASVVEGPTRALELGPMRIVPVEEIMGNP
jgi:predicted Zn-dependent peptidase